MVDLRKMYDMIYPYQKENRIKIEDKFMRMYYFFTISNRPIAFYMNEKFPMRIENDMLVIAKEDNIEFCRKFERIVKRDISILEKIFYDRDEYIRKLTTAKNNSDIEGVVENLFLLGRYGIEWYFPYHFLYEKLRKYFSEEDIDKITDAIKISDELPYYLKIWGGLEKVKRKEISLREFIENYGFYDRKSLKKSKYENEEYLLTLLTKERGINALLFPRERRLEVKLSMLNWLYSKVDSETFKLLSAFAKIDTENEIIHDERAKALKFLSETKLSEEELIRILEQKGVI